MQIICLEEKAFFTLVETVVERLGGKLNHQPEKWLLTNDAMKLLGISSKTTLQKLRDEGRIRFTHPQKKLIMYDRDSILTYLEKNANNTF